jgi:hypothetical protein
MDDEDEEIPYARDETEVREERLRFWSFDGHVVERQFQQCGNLLELTRIIPRLQRV